MSAISISTTTSPSNITQSGTTNLGRNTQPVTPRTTGSLAPNNNVSAPQSLPATSPSSQGTTLSPTQSSIAPSAQPTPSAPSPSPASSAQCPSTPQTKKRSKKLSHLSHISAATWIGVGLALGALVVAVYYGAPMWRLARWTALNDFRASCISDHDRGLQESAKCKTLLADPAKPPPVVKRTANQALDDAGTIAIPWALNITTFIATFVVISVWLIRHTRFEYPPPDSMAKSDVSNIYKHGMGTGQRDVAIRVETPKPAKEHDEWDSVGENEYIVDQAGGVTDDTASEVDSDDKGVPAVQPSREWDEGNDARNSRSSTGSDYQSDNISKYARQRRGAIVGWPHEIGSVAVEQEPILFDGPISALKLRDSIGTRDLRLNHESELGLRAIKVPIKRGETYCKLMASDMLTTTERRAMHEVENNIVWADTLDASERMLRRLSLRSRRYIYLILDPEYVNNACPPLPEPGPETIWRKPSWGSTSAREGRKWEERFDGAIADEAEHPDRQEDWEAEMMFMAQTSRYCS
jgi:hypothetical protein